MRRDSQLSVKRSWAEHWPSSLGILERIVMQQIEAIAMASGSVDGDDVAVAAEVIKPSAVAAELPDGPLWPGVAAVADAIGALLQAGQLSIDEHGLVLVAGLAARDPSLRERARKAEWARRRRSEPGHATSIASTDVALSTLRSVDSDSIVDATNVALPETTEQRIARLRLENARRLRKDTGSDHGALVGNIEYGNSLDRSGGGSYNQNSTSPPPFDTASGQPQQLPQSLAPGLAPGAETPGMGPGGFTRQETARNPKRKSTPPPSPSAVFGFWARKEAMAILGVRVTVQAKVVRRLATPIRDLGFEEVQARYTRFLTVDDPFIASRRPSLSRFIDMIDDAKLVGSPASPRGRIKDGEYDLGA